MFLASVSARASGRNDTYEDMNVFSLSHKSPDRDRKFTGYE